MISRISTFLRNSLESISAHGEYRALEEDLETVQAYLSIESVRFAERLDVRFECDEGLSTALVPAFLLQPLLENAIKHTVAPAASPFTIVISAAACASSLELTVEDNGGGPIQSSSSVGQGIGLANIEVRLQALYGLPRIWKPARQKPGSRLPSSFHFATQKRLVANDPCLSCG